MCILLSYDLPPGMPTPSMADSRLQKSPLWSSHDEVFRQLQLPAELDYRRVLLFD